MAKKHHFKFRFKIHEPVNTKFSQTPLKTGSCHVTAGCEALYDWHQLFFKPTGQRRSMFLAENVWQQAWKQHLEPWTLSKLILWIKLLEHTLFPCSSGRSKIIPNYILVTWLYHESLKSIIVDSIQLPIFFFELFMCGQYNWICVLINRPWRCN